MNDHAGFNGFTQTNFICQQYAWRMAVTDFAGNMQLMRDQADPATGQAASRAAATGVLVDQRFITQSKTGMTIDLTGKQTILRFVEFDEVVQHHFSQ